MAVKSYLCAMAIFVEAPLRSLFLGIYKRPGQEADFLIASAATTTDEIAGGVGNPVYPRLGRHFCVMALTL